MTTDLYDQLVRGIAEGRHKTEAEVRALIDQGPFLPDEALRVGLVDDLAYADQIDDKLQAAVAASCTRLEGRRLRQGGSPARSASTAARGSPSSTPLA